MRARLKKINIAGTWYLEVDLQIHGESIAAVNGYLDDLSKEITKKARHVANKKEHKINLRGRAGVVNRNGL